MTIRKRNDSVKPGCGIDGSEGDNFTKRPTSFFRAIRAVTISPPQGAGVYQDKDASFLRNKAPSDDPEGGKYTLAGGAKDIWDEVEGQSSDSGNRAVRSRGR